MAALEEPIPDAGHPFSPTSNEDYPPDVILRSNDKVDFHVHKAILAFASNFFKNMFSFPEPTGGEANIVKDGKPVVPLHEFSAVIRILLTLIYPRIICTGDFLDLDGVDAAYKAADFYQLSGGQQLLEQLLEEPRFLDKQPHRVFAIACHRGLEKQAKVAAMATLRLRYFVPDSTVPEFQHIPTAKLHQLLQFRAKCSNAMIELLEPLASIVHAAQYSEPLGPDGPFERVWWRNEDHGPGCGPTWVDGPPEYLDPPGHWVQPPWWFCAHIANVKKLAEICPGLEFVCAALRTIEEPILKSMSTCPTCLNGAQSSLSLLIEHVESVATQTQQRLLAEYTFAN
ncbi:hypothetical protein R3P38DRAFT_2852462 [Favolaschia claudopus]|uniref:BTB domain-containing protein n=1 Tax=Favolaschia claudopus TaxID=2862362 RepID=A0AAW0DM67_9AGAR